MAKARVNLTQKSRDHLKKEGYHVANVEQWMNFPAKDGKTGQPAMEYIGGKPTGRPRIIRQRLDCFGFADLIAVVPSQKGTLYIQLSSASNVSNRVKKTLECPAVIPILQSGNRVHIHGWKQGKDRRWKLKIIEVQLNDGFLETEIIRDYELGDSVQPSLRGLIATPQGVKGKVEDDF